MHDQCNNMHAMTNRLRQHLCSSQGQLYGMHNYMRIREVTSKYPRMHGCNTWPLMTLHMLKHISEPWPGATVLNTIATPLPAPVGVAWRPYLPFTPAEASIIVDMLSYSQKMDVQYVRCSFCSTQCYIKLHISTYVTNGLHM